MRFTTQWRAAFRVKSFKAIVVGRKWLGAGCGGGGGGGGGGDYTSLVEELRRRDVDILGWGWGEVLFGKSCFLVWPSNFTSFIIV